MFVRLLSIAIAVAAVCTQAAIPSHWEWIAPQPHRQNWVDITSGPAGFVGLTEGYGDRKIYFSPDGENWQLAQTPTTAAIRRVLFLNGKYLALGDSATILSSADGLDWQIRHTSPTSGWLFDAAYGNGMYVAVGYNSIAYYSKDLKTWSPLTFTAGYSLLNVEFGNGFFLAVANIGKAYKSLDGRVWNEIEWPSGVGAGDWSTYEAGLAFNNGKFILSMSGGTASSADGMNWISCASQSFRKICPIEERFIGITGTSLATSTDATVWYTAATTPGWNSHFQGVAKCNDVWLAVGNAGLIYRSFNGINWQSTVPPVDYSHSKIAFANNAFIRYGDEPGVYVSSDGRDWNFNADAPDFTTLTGGNGAWVGITSDNTAAVSTDTQTWTIVPLPATPYGPLLFGQNTFLIAAEGGALISSNGAAWEFISLPQATSLSLIGFQNGIFAAHNQSLAPMTSTDGRDWTVHPTQEIAAQFFAAGNGRFVGIGGGGMGAGSVVWSTNGVNWQKQRLTTGSTYSYTALAFGGGYFLMTDNRGEIHFSPDGVTWHGEPQAAQPFTGAAYGSGTWIVLGGDSILKSGEPISAKAAVTLYLTRSNFSTWSLMVTGSVGERWQIQSTATVGGVWQPVQSVEIPAAGTIAVSMPNSTTSAFFRAVIQP